MPPDIPNKLADFRRFNTPKDAGYYHGETQGLQQPYTPQQEAASLSELVAWHAEHPSKSEESVLELHQLCNDFCSRTHAPEQLCTQMVPMPDDSKEATLKRWCEEKGMTSCVSPALFGTLRGVAADRDVAPGEALVSLPAACLITYATAMESDLGPVLRKVGLDEETGAVVWAMVDRHDGDSPWAPFWAALPPAFHTGLGADEGDLTWALAPLPWMLQDAQLARQHLAQQYAAVQPVLSALVRAYPAHIKPEYVTYEAYLWAVELWYAYAIQVLLPGADAPVACLVPYTSLINHSPWPHAVHFSRVDPTTSRLNVTCFRSVLAGQQALLSYGPLPNAKLALFYGFGVEGNPYDEMPITLKAPQAPTTIPPPGLASAPQGGKGDSSNSNSDSSWVEAAVQEMVGVGLEHRLRVGCPLPPACLAAARLLAAGTAEEREGMGLRAPAQPASTPSGSGKGKGRGKGKGKGGKGGASKKAGRKGDGSEMAGAVLRAKVSVETELRAINIIRAAVDAACAGLPLSEGSGSGPAAGGGGGEGGGAFAAAAAAVVAGQAAIRAHVLGVCDEMVEKAGGVVAAS